MPLIEFNSELFSGSWVLSSTELASKVRVVKVFLFDELETLNLLVAVDVAKDLMVFAWESSCRVTSNIRVKLFTNLDLEFAID